MRRTAIIVTVTALLGTACPQGSEDPGNPDASSPGPTTPSSTIDPPPVDGETTSPPSNDQDGSVDPLPEADARVEASLAEASQTRYLQEVFLARTPQEAATVAAKVPPGLAKRLRSWQQWAGRALIVVIAGSQPDGTYRARISGVLVEDKGRVATVSGSLERGTNGPQTVSVPWALISVNAAAVVNTATCRIWFAGQSLREFDCG